MSSHGEPIPMTARRGAALRGVAEVPGDKSISHRALILGALSVGETKITGLLEGQDVIDTAKAMRAFGATVTQDGPGEWRVQGVGVGGFAEPADVIDCGNSGTGVRLIMGCMATSPISATFTGDASLRKRPMGRVTDPLALFGARAHGRQGGRLPMTIAGAADPMPVRYPVPMPSAQVKSAVLLAGLNAPGQTVVIEKEATRDHTERMLRGFGAELSVEDTPEGRIITLQGQPELVAQRVAVPRDPSSAAFPVCAALIVPGSEILVPGVSQNPTRNGLFTTLVEMGADITFENPREEGGEPVADLRVRHSSLKGVEVPPARAASMIDRTMCRAAQPARRIWTTASQCPSWCWAWPRSDLFRSMTAARSPHPSRCSKALWRGLARIFSAGRGANAHWKLPVWPDPIHGVRAPWSGHGLSLHAMPQDHRPLCRRGARALERCHAERRAALVQLV